MGVGEVFEVEFDVGDGDEGEDVGVLGVFFVDFGCYGLYKGEVFVIVWWWVG